MKAALLRFAPVYDPRIVTDPKLARTLMVQAGALERIRRDQPLPVLVDHDEGCQVGTVREIFIAPDVLYGRVVTDWYHASVELTDAPEWLKRNGGVSWSHHSLHRMEIAGTTLLRRALINEVSILTPSTQPAEPFARVAWVGEEELASRAAAGEVIYHPPGTVVRRPNSGYVIGVR